MSEQVARYADTALPAPDRDAVPDDLWEDVVDLFDTWHAVKARNARLSTYYNMKNLTKDLGVSIPPQLVRTNVVVGWAQKAVRVMGVRSIFDGYVFGGEQDAELDELVAKNRLRTLYSRACAGSLVHGVSAITVMAGFGRQPAVKVRSFSANQCAMLWDRFEDAISCGIVLANVDRDRRASRYVMHTRDSVVTFVREASGVWTCEREPHIMGRPMMEPLIFDADDDRPLGRSRITPEVMGIIDKAMRDVLRMEVGAEFFTAPQRYILGAKDDLFDPTPLVGEGDGADGDDDDDEAPERPGQADPGAMMRAYLGAFLAITRDENGEIPQVGQFPAGSADNFIKVFENDAQRFSGATNVPLGQLGVLSNTYTSSDALGAANDPLILEVEAMNARNKETMEEVARMMMAVAYGVPIDILPAELARVQAYFPDPARPTIAARADAWTKLASSDQGLPGTRVYYEGVGLPQATIDRLFQEKRQNGSISMLNAIAEKIGAEV